MKLTGLSPPSVRRGRFVITCCAWSGWLNSRAPDRTIKPSVVLRIPSVPISISPVWKAPCGRDPLPCFFQRGSEYGPGRVCPIGQDYQTSGTKVQAVYLFLWARAVYNCHVCSYLQIVHRMNGCTWELPAAEAGFVSSELPGVNCHSHGRVHSGAFQGIDLAHAANSACSSNRQLGDAPKLPKPCKIGALHRAFVIHECGKEARTKRFELRNYIRGPQF